ncbi:nucleotidyltransferase family protein [Sutcliffiella horikoshii]|uniref:nucleotidyltransferase domain-containing protein n=1 Tax=Sutcliffiella horikoshii TaxID=79883 RepID=UPI001CBD7BB8|nr:nucleotidyltransferase family protein [Sutcliffiella horikoshii]UAL46922.1 nucleotidyltransferase family protein [Sutcliffiella horikoshii]
MKKTSLNLAKVPHELLFILHVLKEENTTAWLAQYEQFLDKVNWEAFLKLAKHHRLFPLLYQQLKRIDNPSVPDYVLRYLKAMYQQNTFQMMHLTAEMNHLNQQFLTKDIRTIFLKGPVLAQELYGDISLRTSCDLDVLIPLENLGDAEALLIQLGYEKDDYIETILGDWTWRHHHVTYFHREKGVKCELHWRLNPGPSFEPGFDDLWNRKKKSSLLNETVYMLGKEDLFFFLATHGARHGWSRLRWLVDIQRLLGQEVNWHQAVHLFNKYHFQRIGGQALLLSENLVNSETPMEVKVLLDKKSRQLAQQAIFYLQSMVNLHTDPVPQNVSDYHGKHLFSLMSYQQKALYLLSCLFPFPEDAETLPLPKFLHFLYVPLRPFLWAWRKTKGQTVVKT